MKTKLLIPFVILVALTLACGFPWNRPTPTPSGSSLSIATPTCPPVFYKPGEVSMVGPDGCTIAVQAAGYTPVPPPTGNTVTQPGTSGGGIQLTADMVNGFVAMDTVASAITAVDDVFETTKFVGQIGDIMPGQVLPLISGQRWLVWADFRHLEPASCTRLKTEGDWGLHSCEGNTQMPTDVDANGKPKFPGGRAAPYTGDFNPIAAGACINMEKAATLTSVDLYNAHFESVTYGVAISAGQPIPAGPGVFLGNLGINYLPDGWERYADLVVWVPANSTEQVVVPDGGRWLPGCE